MKIENIEKLAANLHDQIEHVFYIRNLKQALNQELFLKKVHRVIKFNRNNWLRSCDDMNTDLRKKTKHDFEKDFFKMMLNNAVLGKTTENVKKDRDVKHFTTDKRRNYLVLKSNDHRCFTEKLLAIEMKKTEILINKPVC